MIVLVNPSENISCFARAMMAGSEDPEGSTWHRCHGTCSIFSIPTLTCVSSFAASYSANRISATLTDEERLEATLAIESS